MAITRKFQIETLRDRKVVEHVYRFEENEQGVKVRTMHTVERIVPESFMVYFPSGHSIWVENKALLAQYGITEDANVEIDTDTGLPVKPPETNNIKALVARKTVQQPSMGVL